MSVAASPWWQRHALALRLALGGVLGLAAIAALLRIHSEAKHASGVLSTLRGADRRALAVAVLLEAASYVVPALILRRLLPRLRFGTSLRIGVASLGVGPLVPGNPISGTGIGYAELRRHGAQPARAATVAVALVIGLPAASMAVLAGPTLIGSGLATTLPDGWRGVVLVAGCLAILLGGGLAVIILRGAREDRPGRAIDALGGRREATALLLLAGSAWLCDAGCLSLTGRALHTTLPLASLPAAYVSAVVISALPVLPGGLGAVEVSLPAIFAAGGASYSATALVVLVWRLQSFWLPTLAGLGALASLHRSRPLSAGL